MLEPPPFRPRAASQRTMRGRRRVVHGWLVLILCFAAVGGLVTGVVGHVSAQALTFTPIADTYVDSSTPNTNYGSSQLLAVGGNQINVSGGAGTIRQSFLKFSLSGITGPVASATLRLFVENQDQWGASSTGGSVAAMSDTSWSETGVTYNTRPTIDGAVLASQSAVSAGQWYSWDVTASVTGNGTLSLGVTSPDGDGAFYSSRESGADAPQLIVTLADSTATATPTNTATSTPTQTPTQTPTSTATGTPTGTPTSTPTQTPTTTPTNTPTQTPTTTPTSTPTQTPAPTPTSSPPENQSLTFTPTADTYVDSSAPNTNYGSSTILAVGGNQLNVGGGAGTIRQTFLKFNLSGLSSTIASATLRLFVETQDQWGASSTGGSVAAVSDSSWSETGVTYNTRPTIDGTVLATQGAVASGQWYSWDVTAAVTGNGTLSLGVTSPDGDGAFYSSRESGANAPQLIVSFSGSGSPGTPTPTTTPTPTPTPSPNGDPVVAAAGDIACDPSDSNYNNGNGVSGDCQQKATSDLLVNKGYAAVFGLGDEQYESGTLSAFQQSYDPTWGRVKDITYPATGNHEYENGPATGYFQYFGARAGSPSAGYYSFNLGAWHIIVLNSNCDEVGGCDAGSPQEQWLQQDLAANPGVCTLAYWHHPRFNSGYGGSNPAFDAFWQDLYAAGADVVLNGHSHDYERFAPQDPNGTADPTSGITEFVVGTGGESFSDFGTIAANSVVRQNNTFGVLQLTLHADSFSWQFIPIAGKSFTDSGTASCHHGGAPSQPTSTPTSTATSTATVASSPTATPSPSPTPKITPTPTKAVQPTPTPTKPGKKGKGQ